MKTTMAVLSIVCFMAGCSGGDNSSEPECGVNASCAPPPIIASEDILGLWDRSGFRNEQQDILYTFIGIDGEYLVYDFEQDDFGSGENCHTLDVGTINRFTESSDYTIEFRTSESDAVGISETFVTIVLQGENLNVSFSEAGIEEIWTPVIELSRDDLALCE